MKISQDAYNTQEDALERLKANHLKLSQQVHWHTLRGHFFFIYSSFHYVIIKTKVLIFSRISEIQFCSFGDKDLSMRLFCEHIFRSKAMKPPRLNKYLTKKHTDKVDKHISYFHDPK